MQQSLVEFVAAMDKAGFLVRIKDEVRVDQIPKLMEANPTKAILVEKVKDTEFSVLANAYSNQEMFAWAMGCDKSRTGLEMVARSKGRVKWETVETAPTTGDPERDDRPDPPAAVPASRRAVTPTQTTISLSPNIRHGSD